MERTSNRYPLRFAALALAGAVLGGCNTLSRLSDVGDGPELSKITNPTARPSYRPISLPMPAPRQAEANPNSLWRAGARAFFKDQRAKEVGDILTVSLDLADSATLANTSTRARDDDETASVTGLLGLEDEFTKMLPQGLDNATIMAFDQTHNTSGVGAITRSETIALSFAAVVTQILPNGNMVIMGRQEVRVNAEMRELMVTGVVRPEDIDSTNTVAHEDIAEMRVAYGGRGTMSDLQQPRWGTQIWDIVFPF